MFRSMNTKPSPVDLLAGKAPRAGQLRRRHSPAQTAGFTTWSMDRSIRVVKSLVSPNIVPVHFPAIESVVVGADTAVGTGVSIGGNNG